VQPDIADLAYAYQEGEQDGQERRRVSIEDLEIGQQMTGIVSTVTSFGAFVDVGADHQGLVHIREVSENYVLDINAHLQRGQMVKVWVLGLDEQGRLNLSMLDPSEGGEDKPASDELVPFQDVGENDWLDGTVSATTEFGIFVSVVPPGGGPTVTGLVHVSQIREGFVEHPSDEAEIGDEVKVRVVKVHGSRLSLSLRPPPPKRKPDFSRMISTFERLGPTDWIEGRVHHIVPFGAFVEVEPLEGDGVVMGLLHVTEMQEGFVEDPAQVVQLNQKLKVRVISVDAASGRLALSMKEPRGTEVADTEAGGADPA